MGDVLSVAENEQADIILFEFYTLPAGATVSTAERNQLGYRVSTETCRSLPLILTKFAGYPMLPVATGVLLSRVKTDKK